MTAEPLPRRFGDYLLTASLGEDALGRVYRARRLSGEGGFVRLRILESPEIDEDAVLDAIEQNGEIHDFLANPAISRGVQMNAVDGTPFLAWDDPGGRTLDSLLERSRAVGEPTPAEHALWIAEKIATALDHASNTTVDGERILHGMVWPGFVSISDDAETRLTGFGLASGFFGVIAKPHFARQVGPYLAPEQRKTRRVEKNSDVYSVGVILFELLSGRLPSASEPQDLRSQEARTGPIPPELIAILRMCLCDAGERYQSAGALRRELGKLLFSGPYAPSTFNLAFFLNTLFRGEIEAEATARAKEIALDPDAPGKQPAAPAPIPRSLPDPKPVVRRPATLPPAGRPALWRRPAALGGSLLLTAAVAGGIYAIARRASSPAIAAADLAPTPRSVPPVAPPPEVDPAPPTSTVTNAQFQEEVSRRVAQELKKLGEQARPTPAPTAEPQRAAAHLPRPTDVAEAGSADPASAKIEVAGTVPTALPRPTSIPEPPRPTLAEAPETLEVAPRILKIIKATYPPAALKARVGGVVVLRVLVSERGSPLAVEIVKGARLGLSEAAVAAVWKWTFEPGRRDGTPVRAWTTIPIPFEP